MGAEAAKADQFDGGLWSSGPTPEQFQALNAKLFAKDRGLRTQGSIRNLLTENFKFEEEDANEFVQSWQELKGEQAIPDAERRKIRELMDGWNRKGKNFPEQGGDEEGAAANAFFGGGGE